MASQLNKSIQVRTLARDLGIHQQQDAISGIIAFCDRRLRSFLRDFADCDTLSYLLEIAANKLGTTFEVIREDRDLDRIRAKYLARGETQLAGIDAILSDEVLGVTYRLQCRRSWESQFVSMIDCRGDKAPREYFTKWHEVSHLFVLTDQTRLSFTRTHSPGQAKDPEEAVVDLVAGRLGFFPSIVEKCAKGEPSFESIEAVRVLLCPDASYQASTIGLVSAWPHPCLLVRAELASRKGEQDQLGLDFQGSTSVALRAVKITTNEMARQLGVTIYKNMRTPKESIIYKVFEDRLLSGQGEEDIAWWETSDGFALPSKRVRIEARGVPGGVDALVIPIEVQE